MLTESPVRIIFPEDDDPSGVAHGTERLIADHRSLLQSGDLADAALLVDGRRFAVHKVILAARCEYFRCLFFGGMRESHLHPNDASMVPELRETPAEAFAAILQYLYTGRVSLSELENQVLLELVALADRYDLVDLKESVCAYLARYLAVDNACSILYLATLLQLQPVRESCLKFIDANASGIIQDRDFLMLPGEIVMEVLRRDSFFAPETAILRAVAEWCRANGGAGNSPACTSSGGDITVPSQLQAMDHGLLDDLLSCVRTELIDKDQAVDLGAMDAELQVAWISRTESRVPHRTVEPRHRGQLTYDTWLLDVRNQPQAKFTSVERYHASADVFDDRESSSSNSSMTSSMAVTIELPGKHPHIVNHIKLYLPLDKEMSMVAYIAEVGVAAAVTSDDTAMSYCDTAMSYYTVADCSRYSCFGVQHIYFEPRMARVIRVLVPSPAPQDTAKLIQVNAEYSSTVPEHRDGLTAPSRNVALLRRGARVRAASGTMQPSDVLIDGDYAHYDLNNGYISRRLHEPVVVMLPQPIWASSMRFLLWNGDDRRYGYQVSVGTDTSDCQQVVCDKRHLRCRSWQTIHFPAQVVSQVYIVGTHNSVPDNGMFHLVHFECPASPSTDSVAMESAESYPDIAADE